MAQKLVRYLPPNPTPAILQVGDGTTSVVVLAGELLREAEQLVNQRIHPATIVEGFRAACDVARKALAEVAFSHDGASQEFRQVGAKGYGLGVWAAKWNWLQIKTGYQIEM